MAFYRKNIDKREFVVAEAYILANIYCYQQNRHAISGEKMVKRKVQGAEKEIGGTK